MYTKNLFSEFVCLFALLLLLLLSAAVFSQVSSFRFFAFFRSGLLCTVELLLLVQISSPCYHFVGMCPCKARRFIDSLKLRAFLGLSILRFFRFRFVFVLVCCAAHRFGFLTGPLGRNPTLLELFPANQESSLMQNK